MEPASPTGAKGKALQLAGATNDPGPWVVPAKPPVGTRIAPRTDFVDVELMVRPRRGMVLEEITNHAQEGPAGLPKI